MNTFVITGSSGVGKTHLIHELTPLGIYSLEVYTDRSRRPSEKRTTDRVYLTKKEFISNAAEFLYWFEFQGNRYGYKKADIERQKRLDSPICLSIPPSFLPFILQKLPDTIAIHLNVEEEDFPMLFDRMLKRDLSAADNERQREIKARKIKKRLEFAKKELGELANIRKIVSQNPLSRIFNISDDTTIYEEVIPYIKDLI